MTSTVADALLVLVVSDREEMAASLGSLLSKGYRTERTNSREAFDRLQRQPTPALVLIDMLQPSMEEFQLISRIRSCHPRMRIRMLSPEDPYPSMPPETPELEASFLEALERCLYPGRENQIRAGGSQSAEPTAKSLVRIDPGPVQREGAGPAKESLTEANSRGLKSLLRSLKDEAEKTAITNALEHTHWNRKRAAQLLHISYRGLLYKIHQYELYPAVPSPSSPLRNRQEK